MIWISEAFASFRQVPDADGDSGTNSAYKLPGEKKHRTSLDRKMRRKRRVAPHKISDECSDSGKNHKKILS